MPSINNTWVQFKQFPRTSHQELRETSNLTVEDKGMHHSNMVNDVVAGTQAALQQDQAQTDTPTIMQVPVYNV